MDCPVGLLDTETGMYKIDIDFAKDLVMRAAHTFWQGFIGVFYLPVDFLDVGAWQAAAAAGAMAGASAVKTLVQKLIAAWKFR